ncbi:OVARIAN TUMOR DOMAIN-containing deubiquitinating enzyme 9-like isoform X11 [Trifolium pratense]|nr:OVARIAN TUMOR DOMAIN-containing deubiquitinating enzyme 9-like isoform X11 [Trifolium pratense]
MMNYCSGGHDYVHEGVGDVETSSSSSPGEVGGCSLELVDNYPFDDEIGRRLNEITPIPHIPKINGEIPSIDEATSDHERLLDRLRLYDFVEHKVQGDGNCQVCCFQYLLSQLVGLRAGYQVLKKKKYIHFHNFIPRCVQSDFISTFQIIKFISADKFLHSSINNSFSFISYQFRALSDQLYNTPDNHKFVRRKVVNQLKSHPDIYEGYVPMKFSEYLENMSRSGEWGDHVTLQAAADLYGVRIFLMTSFKDTCCIEILPSFEKPKGVIFISFWAEVHYNSIYPQGDITSCESRKKKRWWSFETKHQ